MADFNIVIRIKKEEIGKRVVFPVYISVAHNGSTRYIKTNFQVTESGIKKTVNRVGAIGYEIKDQFILKQCYAIIDNYVNKCNRINISNMNCSELIESLKQVSSKISFTEFSQDFIGKMINEGRERPARNYKSALNSLKSHMGKENFSFSDITSKILNDWISSLSGTKTAKRAYPSAIKAIFNEGVLHYNDYDRDIIQIENDPFKRVKIPSVSRPRKRSVDKDNLLSMFEAETPETAIYNGKEFISRERQAQDVSMLIFCLAGINAADLYDLKKSSLKKRNKEIKKDGKKIKVEEWFLCYNRKKTRDKREDGAYIEIKIPDKIKPLFVKYKGKKNLFDFSDRYTMEESFCDYVNKGLKKISSLTTYSLRHSWATIAQNHCGANMSDIAFGLNHVSGFKITERYVDIDYSPIDTLNEKVISFVFDNTEESPE